MMEDNEGHAIKPGKMYVVGTTPAGRTPGNFPCWRCIQGRLVTVHAIRGAGDGEHYVIRTSAPDTGCRIKKAGMHARDECEVLAFTSHVNLSKRLYGRESPFEFISQEQE